jgi:RNA-directed DNA polymerase
MNLHSTHSLARLLGLSLNELKSIANDVELMYAPFVDRSSTKPRAIHRPKPSLRKLQRKIYDLFLARHAYSEFAFGGVPGRSVTDAVEPHRCRPLIIQVDVKNFFPSITDRAVFGVWRRLGHGSEVAGLLTRLTTYNRCLPLGASTSTALANIYMEPVDAKIMATLRSVFDDIRYTRWVDDMFFSGSLEASAVLSVAARYLREAGLSAHRAREKRRILPSDASQEILGLVVNNGVTLPRRRRRLTRAILHTAQKFGGNVNSVRGHIQHLRTFHESLADQLEDSLRLAPILFRRDRRLL